jgi:hypothetical protein
MEDYHNRKKILGRSLGGKRLVERPRSRWKDSVQKDAVSLLHTKLEVAPPQKKIEMKEEKWGGRYSKMDCSTIKER